MSISFLYIFLFHNNHYISGDMFAFLRLACFTKQNGCKLHPFSCKSRFTFILWLNIDYGILYIQHIFFSYLPVWGHLGWLYIIAVLKNDATNMEIQVSLSEADFFLFGHITRSGMKGSYGRSIPLYLLAFLPTHAQQHLLFLNWG